MVRHIILWKIKEELAGEQRASAMKKAKDSLESLLGVVPGLTKIHVYTEKLPSSNADMMLECEFESAGALAVYRDHPAHVAAANTFVRPITAERVCMDLEA